MSQNTQSAGRRLSTITIDQGIAGASNVLIAVLAARLLGPSSFGLFGICFLVYVTAQGISRALVGEPLLVHPEEAESRGEDIAATAVLVGLVLGGLTLVAGLGASLWIRPLAGGLIALALFLPLLVLQDIGRYRAFAVQRPGFAVVLDTLWLVLLLVAVVVVTLVGNHSLVLFIAIWAGTGAAAGVLSLRTLTTRATRPSGAWLRQTWTFSSRYLLSFSATQGSALAAAVSVAAIAGTRALGAVQGALLTLRPFMMFQAASIAAGVAETSRLSADLASVRRHARRTTLFTSIVAVANMLVLVFLPSWAGELLLGKTWAVTQPLVLAAGSQILCLGLISGPRAALLGLRLVRTTLAIDLSSTVFLLGLIILGAVLDGARGAFWAVAAGQGVMAVVWWTTFVVQASGSTVSRGRRRRVAPVQAGGAGRHRGAPRR
ncbi:MAG TPA: oligosaccharide flippase family protein [Marmoricola sp.]|nr:oligosaccharide flippase family protein [Marmoricola sp.]